MKMSVLLCLLLWSLVEVYSQTEFPYVSFRGENLTNHAFVDLNEVGGARYYDYYNDYGDPGNTVTCHTDLHSCCSNGQGHHRGDWYFPDGTRLGFSFQGGDIYEYRGTQRVDLYRINNANSPSGIYRCDIPTDVIQSENDTSVRETVYVGLYVTGGNVIMSVIYMYGI